ncbi:MAG: TrkA C-terminal domain-containing protein [Acidaminococcaceae bacterium]
MANRHRAAGPVYQKIAFDMAERILEGQYKTGDRISGRSTLAAKYSVSPETIRRAMFILKDLEIVEISSGRGITICSPEKAEQLVRRFKNVETFTDLKQQILTLAQQQAQQQKEMLEHIEQLLNRIEKFRVAAPILPYEIAITKQCRFLGKMISDINFWQSTGVTVAAIRRQGETIISPGPYAVFEEGDVFIMVGTDGSETSVKDYLYATTHK